MGKLSLREQQLAFERLSGDPQYGLCNRTRNILIADGVSPQPDAVIKHYTIHSLKELPRVGPKTIKEIQDWLVRHGKRPLP